MNEYLWITLAYIAGIASAGVFGWSVHRNMCRRLSQNRHMDFQAEIIEMRRYPTEFVNEDEPRPGAGPAGEDHTLFSIRPGALMLAKLAEKNREKA